MRLRSNSWKAAQTGCATVAVLIVGIGLSAQQPKWKQAKPVNDPPNPYHRDANWAQLPSGMKWGAVIGAEPGPDGNVYVVHRCFENSCAGRSEPPIFKFDPAGKVIKSWGAGEYIFPHGFYVDPQGHVWVTDQQSKDGKGNRVVKYDANGTVLLTIGGGKVDQPTDVVTAPNGDIFVTEGHTIGGPIQRVSKWSKDGTFIKAWGRKGSGPGEFDVPHTIAIDSIGRLFVGDRNNNRIQIFDQNGAFLDEWTQFGRPSGIAIAKDDTIYVADSESWGPDEPGWKKGIRVGSARDGSVKYFIEDVESTADDHSGAEGVGVDRDGNVYGAVVRRMMLEKHVASRPVVEAARASARLLDFAQLQRYHDANAAVAASAPNRVVFLGDSITDNWQRPQFGGFFPGKPYLDRGISGQTLPQMLLRMRPDVLALKPAVVVILAGTNDVAANTGPETDEEIEGYLSSICEIADAHHVRIVLASITPISDYHRRPMNAAMPMRRPPERILALNKWIQQYAAAHHHVYLDYFSAMIDGTGMLREDLSEDDLHPNAKGYAIMAPLAEAAIRQALK
jgi:lysophospholipase L1-like esterase/sugar lactone lactonase YvrE